LFYFFGTTNILKLYFYLAYLIKVDVVGC